jgi:hypothetical protein
MSNLYNLTGIEASNNVFELFKAIDSIKPGWFGGLALFSFYLITFMIFKESNTANIFLLDSFAVSFVAVLLFSVGMIGSAALIVPIVLLFASIVLKVWGDSRD